MQRQLASLRPEVPTFVVVCGPPCAGKSAVAARLRTSLEWPLLSKDYFKEVLFDSLGWSDRAWSRKLSGASYAVMFNAASELLAAGHSCILEGNFRWPDTARYFTALMTRQQVQHIQVFCAAQADVLVERWRLRIESGSRHPGHVDRESAAEIEAELRERPAQPLPIGAPIVTFDSTEGFSALDDLVRQVTERR